MIDHIQRIREEAETKISGAPDSTELERLRIHYLGKKGLITNLLHQLKDLTPDKRREVGAALNEIKQNFESSLNVRQGELELRQIDSDLAQAPAIDVTLPGTKLSAGLGSLHPITRVMQEIVECLQKVGFAVATGPEVETEFYNFEALNTPQNHPARDMQDTFYINPPILLRSHTSPVQIRTMQKVKPPLQVIAPGKVYRCDYDQTHSPMFHQVEGLMIDKSISMSDLKGVLHFLIRELFGPRKLRFRPSYFPFTEPSAEVDMQWNKRDGSGGSGWMEIGGCGMVHPNVIRAGGYDPDRVNGFAFGMGLERIAMLKYGIDDLRSFFESDYRMLEQF